MSNFEAGLEALLESLAYDQFELDFVLQFILNIAAAVVGGLLLHIQASGGPF
jgi:hypothetical protein